MSKKSFHIGVIIGAILGGMLAYLYSPKSGKQNRKMVKKVYDDFMRLVDKKGFENAVTEVYGDLTDEGKKVFTSVKMELENELKNIQKKMSEMNVEEYRELVMHAVDKVTKDGKMTTDKVKKIADYYLSKWDVESDEEN